MNSIEITPAKTPFCVGKNLFLRWNPLVDPRLEPPLYAGTPFVVVQGNSQEFELLCALDFPVLDSLLVFALPAFLPIAQCQANPQPSPPS